MIICGDSLTVLKTLNTEFVNCCITSPPYYNQRDYGIDGQIGLEPDPYLYIDKLVGVFSEVKRILKDDGTLWLNISDTYAANRSYQVPSTKGGVKHGPGQAAGGRGSKVPCGLKPKDLIGIPWRLAFALQADGWYLRQDCIWEKPNVFPQSVKDRCTTSHEYMFLLSKSEKYYFDCKAIEENGAKGKRNKRSVWSIPTQPSKINHCAMFPSKLIEPCVLASCPIDGVVLDPFAGSGTTGQVAIENKRKYILIELNPEYIKYIEERLNISKPEVKDNIEGIR
ncbi:MAG: site-specific DNA-methyltransferase [Nanoarchaeota archaeon]